MIVYSQTSEPLVCRANHGITLFPVKLDHPDREKKLFISLQPYCLSCLSGAAVIINLINLILFLTRGTCHAQQVWLHRDIAGSTVPVYVLEETLLTPAVQQLRHHELKESRKQVV